MKCEHCGTDLGPEGSGWMGENPYHIAERCRGALKAQLVEVTRERDASHKNAVKNRVEMEHYRKTGAQLRSDNERLWGLVNDVLDCFDPVFGTFEMGNLDRNWRSLALAAVREPDGKVKP